MPERTPHVTSVVAEVGWAGEPRLVLACTCGWAKAFGERVAFEHVAYAENHHITSVIRRQGHPGGHNDDRGDDPGGHFDG